MSKKLTKSEKKIEHTVKNKKAIEEMKKTTTKKPISINVKDGADFYSHKHIINYLTETDLYKFTQQQFYFHKRSNDRAKWEFKIRSKGVN